MACAQPNPLYESFWTESTYGLRDRNCRRTEYLMEGQYSVVSKQSDILQQWTKLGHLSSVILS